MAVYKYKALNQDKETLEGLVDAPSLEVAAEVLQEKGYAVISIKEEISGEGGFQFNILNKIKPRELVVFSRQFAVMISANVAMVQSLKILVDQTESIKLKMVISEIADEVDSGSRLSESLEKRSKIFSSFYVSVIRAGETSGRLEESLNYLADEMEKDYDMMSKIKGAMIYPIFVLFGLTVVGVVMMIFVVPKLTAILTESGAELPFATRVLIGTSNFMTSYWWLLIIIVGGLIFGARFYFNTIRGREVIDYLLLKLPVFGKLFQRIYLVRFTRSMNTLIVGGVAITESLRIAGDIVSNQVYKKLVLQTIKEVEDGNSISSVFIASKEIPKMVSQMMSIGEKTGKLDVVLARVTDFYGREVNNIVANLMTLMEPIIMVVMGVAVGLMVAAIILPMYNLASNT